MATTIGRVQFIVDLDGDKIPAQARKIARDIAKAGKTAGDDFGGEFENSFTHRLNSLGASWQDAMRKQGRLSSETFMQSFERGMQGRAGRIQSSLADAVGDKDAFRNWMEGFDDVDEGIERFIADLQALTRTYKKVAKEGGGFSKQQVLTKDRLEQIIPAIRAMGAELKMTREQEAELEKQTERLDADIARLSRTVGDTDAFRVMADRVGGSATAYQRLKSEIEGLNKAGAINITQMERMVDALDKTRESADRAAQAERDLARDQRAAAIEADRHADRLAALDQALADVNRRMGNVDVFRDRVRELGSTTRAVDDLKQSFDRLRDLGASERSIASLETRLRGLTSTLSKEQDGPTRWSNAMTKAARATASSWRRMDGTVKLVIGAILSAGDQLSVLGSALGAGLIAVGAAAASMVVGVLGAVAVFKKLGSAIEDVEPSMRGTVESFQQFTGMMGVVGDVIAKSAFAEMNGAFDSLNQTVQALTPNLAKVGTALGKLIKGFADATAPGTEGFEEINELVGNAGPNIQKLGGTVGKFGLALVRAFNGAQPLVEQMFDWLGKLTGRFDAFTKSDDFGDWVLRAQKVFHSLGGLIDALGRALSDLVTPASLQRTTDMIDNLADFMPHASNLLAIFGELDIIGTIALLLANFGEAMAPLAEPTQALAASLGAVLAAVAEATPAFVVLAAALSPIVAGLAGIIAAVPPVAWTALATAASLYAAAIYGMKGFSVVAGVVEGLWTQLQKAMLMTGGFKGAVGAANSNMKRFANTAGGMASIIGVSVAAFLALMESVKDYARELTDIDGITRNALASNQSLIETVDQLSGAADGASKPLTNIKGALDGLSDWNDGNFFTELADTFTKGAEGGHDLHAALKELDGGMKGLPLEEQAKKFKSWAEELGASEEQVLEMLNSMPEYKAALEGASDATGDMATGTDLAKIALEGMVPDVEEAAAGFEELEAASGKTITSIDDLASAIRNFGNETLDVREATRQYEEAIDGLAESITENGNVWDVQSEQGRANNEMLDKMAESIKELSGSTLESTGSMEQANAKMLEGREALVKQLEAYGWSTDAANDYADSVGLIPAKEALAQAALQGTHGDLINALEQFGLTGEEAVIYAGKVEAIPDGAETLIEMLNVDPSIDDAEDVKGAIEKIPIKTEPSVKVKDADKSKTDTDAVKSSMDAVQSKTVSLNVTSNADRSIWDIIFNRHASGTVTKGAELALIGEEGPEAVVPLRRPLNQVDPSVRALSAVAQGKMSISEFSGSGGAGQSTGGGPSRVVNIAPGAIVVQGSLAPEATATMTVNRMAERLA
jgi:hypothetical protein